MKRFLTLEENEDGTTSVTVNMAGREGCEISYLIPMDFDMIAAMMVASPEAMVAVNDVNSLLVPIPNDTSGA